jgi:hypothetical protein
LNIITPGKWTRSFFMKQLFTYILICASALAFAQPAADDPLEQLQRYEKNLAVLGDSTVSGSNWEMREQACIAMVKILVKALQVPNSFDYPFDSVPTISVVYPEDRAFRLITWQLQLKDMTHRYYGTIQMAGEELEMYPLIDMSMFIAEPDYAVTDNDNWYGQIYYNVKKFKYKKETYYLLFGWDGNDMWSNRKIVDILSFDDKGQPVFGRPVFEFSEGEVRSRVMIEYKEDASPALVWDEQLQMIVFDYLQPENPMSEGIYMTYIPDGTYQGFYFDKKKRHWILQRVVFNVVLDEPPLFKPKYKGEDPNMYIKEN